MKGEKQPEKYGRVVIVGRPNTGKSTILNAIMEQKVAITSHLPQTTRKVQEVVFRSEAGCLIISDTPGIIGKVDDLLGKRVNTEAPKEMDKADVIVMAVDISRPKSEEENKVVGLVRKSKAKKILVYNKIDQAVGTKDHLGEYNYLEEEFDKVIAVSALKAKYVKGLINLIFELLPGRSDPETVKEVAILEAGGGPMIGLSSDEYIGEIIREKAYLFLRDEIPYALTTEVMSVEDKGKIIVIKANIITREERYKKIIIGKNGSKIKEIGYNARKELELMSGRKVFLELQVKTDSHWQERWLTG